MKAREGDDDDDERWASRVACSKLVKSLNGECRQAGLSKQTQQRGSPDRQATPPWQPNQRGGHACSDWEDVLTDARIDLRRTPIKDSRDCMVVDRTALTRCSWNGCQCNVWSRYKYNIKLNIILNINTLAFTNYINLASISNWVS